MQVRDTSGFPSRFLQIDNSLKDPSVRQKFLEKAEFQILVLHESCYVKYGKGFFLIAKVLLIRKRQQPLLIVRTELEFTSDIFLFQLLTRETLIS